MKKLSKILASLALVISAFYALGQAIVSADTVPITIMNSSLSTTSVTGSETTEMSLDFSVPDSAKSGDTTTISLPDELKFTRNQSFNVYASDGSVAATAVIDAAAKTLILTYTDYVNSHSDVTGTLTFQVGVDTNVVTENTTISTAITVGGNLVTIGSGSLSYGVGQGDGDFDFYKYGVINYDTHEITYVLNINTSNSSVSNVVLTDELQSAGLSYVDGSFSIHTGSWYKNANNQWSLGNGVNVTDSYAVNISGNSYTVNLGNITQGFSISYKVKIGYDAVNGEKFLNSATVTSEENESTTANNTVTYQSASGSANGYNYNLTITKQNEDGDSLAGATFEVIRTATGEVVGTITTDSTGTGSLSGLLKDDYTIVETSAPAGYRLAENVTVSASDFDTTGAAVTVVDQAETTTTTSTTTTTTSTTTEASTTTTAATTTESPTTTTTVGTTTEVPVTTEEAITTTEAATTTAASTTTGDPTTAEGTSTTEDGSTTTDNVETTIKENPTTTGAGKTTVSSGGPNKKGQSGSGKGLPSTGERAGLLLTIVGLIIIAVAGGYFFITKKQG
ncbi:LPXTG cell wall anchor domain-containing protein [Streptococcus pantholopis]|nr:LPXTG cell wall anchor domain-containing protein [Streptococcus pantholopis]